MIAAVLIAAFAVSQTPAPAATSSARRYGVDAPVKAEFSVVTNVGVITGTIDVTRLDARGIEGWGPFEIRGEVDPWSVSTGDPILDRHIARTILQANDGGMTFASVDKLPPRAPGPDGVGEPVPGARFYLDARRGGRAVEVRMTMSGDGEVGRVTIHHHTTLAAVGLPNSSHPFIDVTGELELKLDARVSRRR